MLNTHVLHYHNNRQKNNFEYFKHESINCVTSSKGIYRLVLFFLKIFLLTLYVLGT